MKKTMILAALLCAAAPGFAQVTVGQPNTNMLLVGTPVPLRLIDQLTTKDKRAKVGDRFSLEVTEAVSLNGVTVIPVGARAVGEVSFVRNKGMFGKSGLIETRLLYVRVQNRNLRITGHIEDKGVAGGVGAGVATYATLVGGLLVTGTSALIPVGTQVTGFLEEDVPVSFGAAIQQPAPVEAPRATGN